MKILIDGQTLNTPEINRGIGTYFRNTLENILESDLVNDFYINTGPGPHINALSPWARNRLGFIEDVAYQPLTNHVISKSSEARYSAALNDDIERLGIDIYWSPNGLMSNVVLPAPKAARCHFAVTIFDVIYLVMEKQYASHLTVAAKDAYQMKLKNLAVHYSIFFHISSHTRFDFIRAAGTEESLHIVTPLAAAKGFRPYPFPAVPAEENYVLYTGGFDPRKNMDRAVSAFSRLHELHGADIDLKNLNFVIVCGVDQAAKESLLAQAKALGVAERIRFTGFIGEKELVSLYQKARCLFFPSLYEGFGLPALEALACGLPVALSNTSSLPEVGRDFALYFDPVDIDDMAAVLYRALREPVDQAYRQSRFEYTQEFSWRRTALKTMSAFETVSGASNVARLSREPA